MLNKNIMLLVCLALLGRAGVAQAAAPVVVDNSSAQFSTVGTWPTSTAVPGYEGAHYQTHAAQGNPPGAIVVDNGGAGFSVTGTWPASTAVGGYFGTNYQTHVANGEEPGAIVVDNSQGTAAGAWSASTAVGGYFGANYQTHPAGSGSDSFTWTPNVPATGSYKVYARWTQHPNRATNAQYTITHASGTNTVSINQQQNGGQWLLLGTFTLNAGSGHSVVLSDAGNGYLIADAIKVVPEGAAPSTATWTPAIPEAKAYRVYARWTQHANRATNAQYTITHAGGTDTVTVNQQHNGNAWNLLGTYTLAPNQGHNVSLTDQANGYVIADAIRLIAIDAPEFNSATWTPNMTGSHEVYAKWTQHANRATNAVYTVTHAQGTTPVTVNQQQNGGTWQLLGSFNLTAQSTITLTDNANGYVIADAVQLISTGPAPLQLYFIHTDHLNTPRVITSQAAQVVWRWDNTDPFGGNPPDENPSGLGNFTCNLRLPGQYFDRETNTHYNYFRDYDPTIGRYVQSDSIGLRGGLNTYIYAYDAPLRYTDPKGLEVEVGVRPFYPIALPLVRHCFVRFNRNNQDTLGFSSSGVGLDPNPGAATFSATSGPENDSCVREKLRQCSSYSLLTNNCCDCVAYALDSCGLKKVGAWPNLIPAGPFRPPVPPSCSIEQGCF